MLESEQTHPGGIYILEIVMKTSALEILEYLDRHGETKQAVLRMKICLSSEILLDRLEALAGKGLIVGYKRQCDESRHVARHWALTERGALVLEKLREADRIMNCEVPGKK